MLKITIPSREFFDDNTEEFIVTPEQKLTLEHSLVSISKWEAKWQKPFMSTEKTDEMVIDYIRDMTLTQNVDPNVYYFLSRENMQEITDYIAAPMTATWFSKEEEKRAKVNREVITSELIYYWMIELNIPVEFQKWHLSRLLTLIKVCGVKNAPEKKMSKSDIMKRNASLNAQRRAAMKSKG